ncbi:hypothetical protein DMUE_0445 [Dictyocoela muelleri]|nr:hypothetical protein DMUE_0445 [Dictyocoela muelleri]
MAERVNCTITSIFRMLKNSLSLNEIIVRTERNLNMTPHTIMKYSPYEVIYKKTTIDSREQRFDCLSKIIENSISSSLKNSVNKNKKRTDFIYNPGTKVFGKSTRNRKLQDRFFRPYIVKKVSCDGNRSKLGDEKKDF